MILNNPPQSVLLPLPTTHPSLANFIPDLAPTKILPYFSTTCLPLQKASAKPTQKREFPEAVNGHPPWQVPEKQDTPLSLSKTNTDVVPLTKKRKMWQEYLLSLSKYVGGLSHHFSRPISPPNKWEVISLWVATLPPPFPPPLQRRGGGGERERGWWNKTL